MDTSYGVLHERPPKSKRKRRKDSNPDSFTTQNNAAADVIHLRIPEPQKSTTPTTRTSRKINSVDVAPHSQGSGSILGSATRDDYLLAIEDAIDAVILACKIHSTQHPEPTQEQLHEQKLMDTACISLQKITKNLVGGTLKNQLGRGMNATEKRIIIRTRQLPQHRGPSPLPTESELLNTHSIIYYRSPPTPRLFNNMFPRYLANW